MSTGTKIIKRALQKIGANSIVAPATPDSIILGMEELNSMLEMWLSRRIKIGFTPLDVPGDELNEPADTYSGIVSNLSVRLAPDFDNGKVVVTQVLISTANREFNNIRRQYQSITIPTLVPSSTLPVGQGNNIDGFFRQPFFGQDAEID